MTKLREFYTAHRSEASSLNDALDNTARELVEFIRDGSARPEELSIREMFEIFVLDKAREEKGLILDPNTVDFEEIHEDIASSHFPYATGKLIHPLLIENYEKAAGNVLPLFTETNSRHREEDIVGFGAADRARHVEETMPYPEAQFNEKRAHIRNHKFGKIISLTVESVLFDQTDQILDQARTHGGYLGDVLEEFACYRLCDSAYSVIDETTSQAMVIDGTRRAMYADTHASWDTYANDNLIGSGNGAKPTATQVESMWNLLSNMVDDKNNPIRVRPVWIFAHDQMWTKIAQFFGNAFDVDSAERNENIWRGKFRIFTSPFMPNTADWYMGDPTKQFRVQWVWRPKVVADRRGDPRRDLLASFGCSMYLGIGATDYRFVARNFGS